MLSDGGADCAGLRPPYLLRQSHDQLFITGREKDTDNSKESNSHGKVPLDLSTPPNIWWTMVVASEETSKLEIKGKAGSSEVGWRIFSSKSFALSEKPVCRVSLMGVHQGVQRAQEH